MIKELFLLFLQVMTTLLPFLWHTYLYGKKKRKYQSLKIVSMHNKIFLCNLYEVFGSRVLICLFAMSYAQYGVAQTSNFYISGQVIDHDSIGVVNCPIALWRYSDSTLVATSLSDEKGQFIFRNVSRGKYSINLGNLQYEKQLINVQISNTNIALPQIVLKEYVIDLDEVVVKQKRSLIKVQPGEVRYFVDADPLAKTSSLYQVFQRLPLISLSKGGITIKGSIAPTFFINGVPAAQINENPQETLKSIRAELVKEIQIITTPGAKYDADFSGGIINIITKRKFETKATGSVGLTLNTRNQYSGSGTIAFQVGKLTLQGNITYGNQKGYKEQWGLERTSIDDPKNHFFQQEKERVYHKNSNLIAATLLTWEPNANDLLIVGYNYLKLDTRGEGMQKHSMYTLDNSLNCQYQIQELNNTIYESMDAYSSFQHKWGKGNLILLMYQYKSLPKKEYNTFLASQIINFSINDQRFKQTTHNVEHTLQGDATYTWKDVHSVNGGIKGIIRTNSNDSRLQNRNNSKDNWIEKNDINDLFSHNQYILGVYTEYQLMKKPWNLRVGIRDEWTMQNIKYQLSPSDNFSTNFNNFLISCGLNYSISSTNSISLNYRSNIRRPSIRHLNPKASINDPSYVYYGNPNLKSEMHHSWSSDWSIYGNKGLLNLSAELRYSRNAIQPNYGILPNGVMYRSYNNDGKYYEGGLSSYGSYNISDAISASINGYITYRNINGVLANTKVSNKGFWGGASASITLNLPKEYYLNFYGGFNSSAITLEGRNYNFYHCGGVLSKSFLNERLNVSFSAIDFLWDSKRYRRSYQTPDFKGTAYYQNYGILLELGVTYRFNMNNIKGKKATKRIQNKDVLDFETN